MRPRTQRVDDQCAVRHLRPGWWMHRGWQRVLRACPDPAEDGAGRGAVVVVGCPGRLTGEVQRGVAALSGQLTRERV